MKRNRKQLAVLAAAAAIAATPAMSHASSWYNITIDTTPVTTAAGVVIGAIAAVWAVRKVVKLVNRS